MDEFIFGSIIVAVFAVMFFMAGVMSSFEAGPEKCKAHIENMSRLEHIWPAWRVGCWLAEKP